MKNYLTLAALVPTLLLVPARADAGCPEWTRSGQSPEYPRSRFLVGLGVAGGMPSQAAGEVPAKTAALSDMSKQIVASISSTTTVEASGSSSGGGHFSVQDKSTIKSAIKLPDAQIVARCFDPQQATLYALAAVDVARAALCPLLSWAHVLFTVGLLDRARLPLKGVRPITPYSWYRVQSETQKRGPYHGVLVRARGKKLIFYR